MRLIARRVMQWVGRQIDSSQLDDLETFADWLRREAIPGGGMAKGDAQIVATRHIGDSLTFLAGWTGEELPKTMVDLGSGVGLPGIPLAIVVPEVRFRLVDRSERRVALCKRAIRVLGLTNVDVTQREISKSDGRYGGVVSRAAMPPRELGRLAQAWLQPGGRAVIGGSHVRRPQEEGFETLDIPTEILDYPAWLLMMAAP